jgi:hypothetical protein
VLDELFDLFERDKRRSSGGGLRGRLARAIGGHDDRDRPHEDDRRRDREEEDERYERRRGRREREWFDDD